MGKAGRPPTLDPVKVAADIAALNGNLAAVAKKNGVDRSAVSKLVSRNKTLQAVLVDAREGMKDNAESALYRAVLDGQAWAVCFFLKTQAKDRGYVEKASETDPAKQQETDCMVIGGDAHPGRLRKGPR